jgi:glucan phosphorylase
MSLWNTASAEIFSADRSVREYAENIWHIHPVIAQNNKKS